MYHMKRKKKETTDNPPNFGLSLDVLSRKENVNDCKKLEDSEYQVVDVGFTKDFRKDKKQIFIDCTFMVENENGDVLDEWKNIPNEDLLKKNKTLTLLCRREILENQIFYLSMSKNGKKVAKSTQKYLISESRMKPTNMDIMEVLRKKSKLSKYKGFIKKVPWFLSKKNGKLRESNEINALISLDSILNKNSYFPKDRINRRDICLILENFENVLMKFRTNDTIRYAKHNSVNILTDYIDNYGYMAIQLNTPKWETEENVEVWIENNGEIEHYRKLYTFSNKEEITFSQEDYDILFMVMSSILFQVDETRTDYSYSRRIEESLKRKKTETDIFNRNFFFMMNLLMISGMCEKCLEVGYDINGTDVLGNTPLHYTCFFNMERQGNYLLSRGANKNIKNNFGLIPEQMKEESFEKYISILKKRKETMIFKKYCNTIFKGNDVNNIDFNN